MDRVAAWRGYVCPSDRMMSVSVSIGTRDPMAARRSSNSPPVSWSLMKNSNDRDALMRLMSSTLRHTVDAGRCPTMHRFGERGRNTDSNTTSLEGAARTSVGFPSEQDGRVIRCRRGRTSLLASSACPRQDLGPETLGQKNAADAPVSRTFHGLRRVFHDRPWENQKIVLRPPLAAETALA